MAGAWSVATAMIAGTQGRFTTSLSPDRKLPPMDAAACSSDGGRSRSRNRTAPPAAKAEAISKKTTCTFNTARSTPATAGPVMPMVRPTMLRSALASRSCSRGTMTGMIAPAAGSLIDPAIPLTTAGRTSQVAAEGPNAKPSMTANWIRSLTAIAMDLRILLSNAPLTRAKMEPAAPRTPRIKPSIKGPCSTRTRATRATGSISEPRSSTPLPQRNSLNPRFLRVWGRLNVSSSLGVVNYLRQPGGSR